jgi:HEAT repeat protein
MTTKEIDKLFAEALLGDYDYDAPWAAVKALRRNGNREIFDSAAAWCASPEALKRARGADILCQLRAPGTPEQELNKAIPDPIYVPESFDILYRMIVGESDEQALASELYGLGHLRQEGSVSTLVPFATHTSSEIRFAVACALGSFPNDPGAIPALIGLAGDQDDEVRDWSLFALGSQGDTDTPNIREVFVCHLDDPCPNAREEAIAGLAKRKDHRAALPLLRLMQSGSYFSHHEYDFRPLLDAPDDVDWGTEDYIDALYARFPELLPLRENV